MKVLVEAEMLRDVRCGIGQFCLHLLQALAARPGGDAIRALAPASAAERIPAGVGHFDSGRHTRARVLPWLRPSVDVWHCTTQGSALLPWSGRTPLVLTLHDLNFLGETGPEESARRLERLRKLAARARLIATDSNYVAGEIGRHLEVAADRVRVVPLAAPPADAARVATPAIVPGPPFLFSIGLVVRKKNFHVLLDMLARLPDYALVIAGSDRKRYAQELRERAVALKLQDRVHVVGSIPDEEKNWYLQECAAFVFPSLLEGFGIPVLEALARGKPTFTSRCTSLPEVGGTEAIYWPDFEPDSMADVFRRGMERIRSDAGAPARMRRWAGRFTWAATAERYREVYHEAAS